MIEKQNEKKWSYKWKPKWKINEKNIFKHFQSVARSESYNPCGVVGIAALLCRWQTVGGGSIPHWSAGKGNGLGHKKNDFARCFELLDNILLPIFISFLQSSADTNDCLLKLHWPSFTFMTWQIWWTIFMSMDTPLFVSLQDARLQLVAFQRNYYQAIKMTLQRLENLFQRHWREKWVGGKWIHGTLITQLIPLAFLCDKTVVTDWADGRSTFRVTPLEKESGCVIWLSFTCMSISADCILLDVLFHCWLVGHS